MKHSRSNALLPEKSIKRQALQIGVVSAVLVFVIALMVWNTSGLNETLKRSTKQYVRDVSYQLTNDITTQLKAFEMALELVVDSVPGILMTPFYKNFSTAKPELLNFDVIAVLDQGKYHSQGSELSGLGNVSEIRLLCRGRPAWSIQRLKIYCLRRLSTRTE